MPGFLEVFALLDELKFETDRKKIEDIRSRAENYKDAFVANMKSVKGSDIPTMAIFGTIINIINTADERLASAS